jgi:hypothetical protein
MLIECHTPNAMLLSNDVSNTLLTQNEHHDIHSTASSTPKALPPSFSKTLTTLSPSSRRSSSALTAKYSIHSCTVICFSLSPNCGSLLKTPCSSKGVDWKTISRSTGVQGEAEEGERCDDAADKGGGRADGGNEEGGAFSILEFEGEGCGVGERGCGSTGSGVSCFGGDVCCSADCETTLFLVVWVSLGYLTSDVCFLGVGEGTSAVIESFFSRGDASIIGWGSSISSAGSGTGSGSGAATTTTSSASGSGSGSGCAFFPLVDLVVFAFLDLVAFFPPAAFRLPLLVAVDATDMFDWTDTVLVSIDSSKSGISTAVEASASDWIDMFDCIDRRVEALVDALDVLADFEARPFFAFGLFAGALVPANTKNGHSGLRR